MNAEGLREALERRAPGQWELYEKLADSRELSATPAGRTASSRREEGWAARWWEEGSPRFACGSCPERLEAAIAEASRLPTAPEEPVAWPAAREQSESPETVAPAQEPPDLFAELYRFLSTESRGEALLAGLTLRRGSSLERIWNGRGLDVRIPSAVFDGRALAVGRRATRACEATLLFRWEDSPDLASLARRLSDRATLPLSDRASPLARGEWLLDPSVGAAILSSLAPLLAAQGPLPKWVQRGQLFSRQVTVVDDAAADAPCDGEGTPTRRVTVVDEGSLAQRLTDLRAARASGVLPTGHGARPSYQAAPSPRPRRIFFETAGGDPPAELLRSVRRGLFASALTAPPRIDLSGDRYELEFTGVALLAGRAQAPVAGARARGRLSELLRRIRAVSTDRQFFPMPFPAGSPTILIDRAEFD